MATPANKSSVDMHRIWGESAAGSTPCELGRLGPEIGCDILGQLGWRQLQLTATVCRQWRQRAQDGQVSLQVSMRRFPRAHAKLAAVGMVSGEPTPTAEMRAVTRREYRREDAAAEVVLNGMPLSLAALGEFALVGKNSARPGIDEGGIDVVNTTTGAVGWNLPVRDAVLALAAHGRRLFCTGTGGKLHEWEWYPAPGRVVREVPGHTSLVTAVELVRNRLATGSVDGSIRVLDLTDNTSLEVGRHRARVSCIKIHRSTGLVFSGSWDKTVRRFDPTGNGEIGAPITDNQEIVTIELDGAFLVTGGSGGSFAVWNHTTGTLVQRVETHRSRVLSTLLLDAGELLTGHRGRVFRWHLGPDFSAPATMIDWWTVHGGKFETNKPDTEIYGMALSEHGVSTVDKLGRFRHRRVRRQPLPPPALNQKPTEGPRGAAAGGLRDGPCAREVSAGDGRREIAPAAPVAAAPVAAAAVAGIVAAPDAASPPGGKPLLE